MLPDRKRNILIGIIAVLLIVIVVFAIYFITSFIKNGVTKPFESDAYPLDYKYIGIQYDEINKYQTIVILKEDFSKIENVNLRSFFEIKDMKVKNNRLYFYSDAINEVAYDKEKDSVLIHEVNEYYNNKVDLKLSDNYIVFLTETGSLEYRKFDAKEKDENDIITSGLNDRTIAVIGDVVYYHGTDGIMSYDLNTKTSKAVITEVSSPTIVEYNEQYLLLKTKDEYFVYEINDGDVTFFDIITGKSGIKALSLYSRGFIYELIEENGITKVVSYNAFFKRPEESPYKIPEGYRVNEMYNIKGNNCYMDLVNENDEHNYYIFNAENNEIVATLENSFQNIVWVQ